MNETFVPVGPDYCVQHHGIREEDANSCDFKERADHDSEAPFPCRFRALGYMKASR